MIKSSFFLYTFKWLKVLLFNSNDPNQYYSFVCARSNDFKYSMGLNI